MFRCLECGAFFFTAEGLEQHYCIGDMKGLRSCYYCKRPVESSALPYIVCHASCVEAVRFKRAIKRLKSFSGIICLGCGCSPSIYEFIEPKTNLKHFAVDFHEHHLVYPGEGVEYSVYLCNQCHVLQKSAGNPDERIKQLALTQRERGV